MTTSSAKRAALGLLALSVLSTGTARAASVVALTNPKVAQFQEAVVAARGVNRDLAEVDAAAGDALEQVKRHNPNVVLAVGQEAVKLAQSGLTNLPVVYCMVLERNVTPSSTITGVPLEVSARDQLARFKELNPNGKRIGIIFDPKASGAFVSDAKRAADALGLDLIAKTVNDPRDIRTALETIAGSIDALWLAPDPRLVKQEVFSFLLQFTLERKIALYGFLDTFTKVGALASVAPNYSEIGKRAGQLAAEIAARPADKRLPVPAPAHHNGSLTVNLKTAKHLGVDVPQRVLDGASQVFR